MNNLTSVTFLIDDKGSLTLVGSPNEDWREYVDCSTKTVFETEIEAELFEEIHKTINNYYASKEE